MLIGVFFAYWSLFICFQNRSIDTLVMHGCYLCLADEGIEWTEMLTRGIDRTGVAEEATRSPKPIGNRWCCHQAVGSVVVRYQGIFKKCHFLKKMKPMASFENSFCKSCRSNDTFVYIWKRWICKSVWVKSGVSHCSCQFTIGQEFYPWVQACCWSSSQRRRFL